MATTDGEPPFLGDLYTRAAAATRWLGAMIDPTNGDGPNLGPNDGAHPYRLDIDSAYRDFRPCLQLASLLFIHSPAIRQGPWDESPAWLGVHAQRPARPWLEDLSSALFIDGGYVVMRNSAGARVLLRAPSARFRPGHADALHVDLWWRGINFLRDGGSYAYVNGGIVAKALVSVVGHNTLQFDDHDQMPRLGRFLYGSWVRVVGTSEITTDADAQCWTGSYTDVWGARHKRTVTLRVGTLSVTDQVQGFQRKAVLRWRLAPGAWLQNDTGCASAMGQLRVECSVPIRRMSLESGWESLPLPGKVRSAGSGSRNRPITGCFHNDPYIVLTMHVLYFHQYFSTPDGSDGTRSYEISKRLLASGHRVTMVCGAAALSRSGLSGPFLNGRREGRVDGIYVIELELPYSNYDSFLRRSWTFLRFALRSVILALQLDYEVVFATSTPLTAALPGIAARWLRRKPFVFEVRDLWPESCHGLWAFLSIPWRY